MEITKDQKKKLVNCCPRQVFDYNEKKDEVKVVRESNCVFCEECQALSNKWNIEDLVKIEDGDYIFEVEGTGSLRSDDIIASAFDRLADILKNLEEALVNIDYINK